MYLYIHVRRYVYFHLIKLQRKLDLLNCSHFLLLMNENHIVRFEKVTCFTKEVIQIPRVVGRGVVAKRARSLQYVGIKFVIGQPQPPFM